MSIQVLQEFIGRNMVASGVLIALAVALDAKVSGILFDSRTAKRIQELFEMLGVADLLSDVGF